MRVESNGITSPSFSEQQNLWNITTYPNSETPPARKVSIHPQKEQKQYESINPLPKPSIILVVQTNFAAYLYHWEGYIFRHTSPATHPTRPDSGPGSSAGFPPLRVPDPSKKGPSNDPFKELRWLRKVTTSRSEPQHTRRLKRQKKRQGLGTFPNSGGKEH